VRRLALAAARHEADVERRQEVGVDALRGADDDLVDVAAGQHRQRALVHVHDGHVGAVMRAEGGGWV
jgi:hypothetical protein